MAEIELSFTRSDNIKDQFKSLINFFNVVYEINTDEKITVDLKNFKYCPPMFNAFLSSLDCERFKFVNNTLPYCQTVFFLKGLKHDEHENWSDVLNGFKGKTYTPLINFSNSKKSSVSNQRDEIISYVGNMVKDKAKLTGEYVTTFKYIISELTDNIVEHSGSERGFLCSQFYEQKGYIDICIIDKGVGLLGSYQNHEHDKFRGIETHVEALSKALEGLSTKNVDEKDERGYGFHTSHNIVVKGLKSDMFIWTGDALSHNTKGLKTKSKFDGVLIFFRIPVQPDKDFKLYDYVER